MLFLNIVTFGQKSNFTFSRPSVNDIDSIEISHDGHAFTYNSNISFQISSNYFPNSDKFNLGQPIASNRKTEPTKTLVNYYYSLPDSTIRLIEYTWNQSKENSQLLETLFEDNSKYFSSFFSNNGITTSEDHGDWTQKATVWENDSTYIKQFMVVGSGTFRVRLLISWK